MIDKELSKQATAEDALLLEAAHPLRAKLLTIIGGKWRLKKVPLIGTVISDPEMIREVHLNETVFGKNGKSTSSKFWNPMIGEHGLLNINETEHRNLKATVAAVFAKGRVESIVCETSKSILARSTEQLRDGHSIDMVAVASEIAYLTTWSIVGFPEERLLSVDIQNEIVNLREVIDGAKPTKKRNNSSAQTEKLQGKLNLIETLVSESFHNDDDSLPALLRREGYSKETATSLTKLIFATEIQMIMSFIPRMTALFIKTRYIDYLASHPEHISRGVDEGFRVIVPIPVTSLNVLQNTNFHGVELKEGKLVLLSALGASKKQGDFDPFAEPNKTLKALWLESGEHTWTGVETALAQALLVAEFLADISMDEKLEVVSQSSNDNGHTGSYEELVIACKLS